MHAASSVPQERGAGVCQAAAPIGRAQLQLLRLLLRAHVQALTGKLVVDSIAGDVVLRGTLYLVQGQLVHAAVHRGQSGCPSAVGAPAVLEICAWPYAIWELVPLARLAYPPPLISQPWLWLILQALVGLLRQGSRAGVVLAMLAELPLRPAGSVQGQLVLTPQEWAVLCTVIERGRLVLSPRLLERELLLVLLPLSRLALLGAIELNASVCVAASAAECAATTAARPAPNKDRRLNDHS